MFLCFRQCSVSTLPTKVHLVKALVFPVVMYGSESWTIKKAGCQRIDTFEKKRSKNKGKKERHKNLNAEFQRIARRD